MGWEDNDEDEENTDSSSGINVDDLAPDALGKEEAVNLPKTETVLVWADPGDGKTHFGYTMPDPVVVIDTEGKAHEIAHKFDGIEGEDDPFIIHVQGFDEAVEGVKQGLKILNAFKDEHGVRGTLMVDSMSKMWEWSKTKYKTEKYPNTPNEQIDIDFDSGIDVWNDIKKYHNDDFRSLMLNSGFNVCWTARRKQDVGEAIDEELDFTPYKPEGERGNTYEANTVLHIHRNNDERIPEAQMEKCGAIKNHYSGLKYPTYDKHRSIIESIEAVEIGEADYDMETVEEENGIRVFEGKPKYVEE